MKLLIMFFLQPPVTLSPFGPEAHMNYFSLTKILTVLGELAFRWHTLVEDKSNFAYRWLCKQ
jgi:hypothetical protein